MTIGQVIELITKLFELLSEYFGDFFKKDKEGAEDTTAEA